VLFSAPALSEATVIGKRSRRGSGVIHVARKITEKVEKVGRCTERIKILVVYSCVFKHGEIGKSASSIVLTSH
jgi:hypothetical protein